MATEGNSSSRIAAVGRLLALVGMALGVGSVAAAFVQVISPMAGFGGFALGVLLSLLALVCSLLGLYSTRAAAGLDGRGDAVSGALVSGSMVVALLVALSGQGADAPPINDFTTDINDPPVFVKALEDPANEGNPMAYPGEEFAAQQRQSDGDLAPLLLAQPYDLVFDRVQAALEDLASTTVTDVDRASGRLEASATSSIFHFVDDVVVRVRATAEGTQVDVRSRSRDGRGDLGVNAARIRTVLSQVAAGR
ncbi:MAG: DUF1499 domain-containing protein [Proteobacteria bacterium]|nr:DUF1499 domain-containing protein [Pseudomonadota bacterium]